MRVPPQAFKVCWLTANEWPPPEPPCYIGEDVLKARDSFLQHLSSAPAITRHSTRQTASPGFQKPHLRRSITAQRRHGQCERRNSPRRKIERERSGRHHRRQPGGSAVEDYFRLLRSTAANAYIDAVTARLNVEQIQKSYQSLRDLANLNDVRFKDGAISEADDLQARLAALELSAPCNRLNQLCARMISHYPSLLASGITGASIMRSVNFKSR